MPDATSLLLFVPAALVLLVVPGPSVLYIVTQSVSAGRRAGLVSMLGIQAGALVHVTAAALGLSALIVSSALAFGVVKYAGAAYLVVLGVRRLLAKESFAPSDTRVERSYARLFRQGVVVNVLNPKTALFFFAFLPQFVDASNGSAALQMLVLGLLFVALAVVSDGAWALLAGTAAGWLRGNPRFVRGERVVSGSVLVGLGLATAVTGSRKT
jgi:threonine/homoserine/homoserine lactone efflux protein